MRLVFLDAGTFYGHPDIQLLLSSFGEVVLYHSTSVAEVFPRIQGADIVLTNKVKLGEEHFARTTSLKLVCVTATGTNNIDLEAAAKYGIAVKNAANYSTFSVAQTTLAMSLHLLMKLAKHQQFVHQSYAEHSFFTHLSPDFPELANKTWGIIGLGNIGKRVAEIVQALGCQVVYHSPSGKLQETSYPHFSLLDLMKRSDVISIHTPLNTFTQDLIGEEQLRVCQPHAIIINVARGGIVDEYALAKALDNDWLAGAGVDVFSVEPILPENPLLSVQKKEKLLVTPHIAWGSREARERLIGIVCGHIRELCQTSSSQKL